jgi:predicted N-acetyltransferase YhbS
VFDDPRFTRFARGRFRGRYGPLGRGASHSSKKLCLVATDPEFLSELLYGLSLRADCYYVKYGTVAREGMYLGRCFLATDEAAGKLCQELKGHPRVMVSLQDDTWFESFRSAHGANDDSSVWDDWTEHEPDVAALIASAFGGDDEVQLVRGLRAAQATTISLVAGVRPVAPEPAPWPLVGYVALSPVTLEGVAGARGLGLGPLAVTPEFQRRGFGARLVEAGLRRARSLGCEYVVVSGLPDFFARFGFRQAAEFALQSAEAEPDFQALELVADALAGKNGLVRRHPAFARTRTPAAQVALEALKPADGELLANLLELYVHDLSAIFTRVELGPDGRFGYPALPTYLSGRTDRFAFLIRCDGHVAGFALAQRGSPVADDPNVLDIAEFFVLRRFRERGVGRAAAALLWDRLPGTWTIRAAVHNARTVPFWRGAVAAYTHGTGTEREHLVGSSKRVVFSFDSAARGG